MKALPFLALLSACGTSTVQPGQASLTPTVQADADPHEQVGRGWRRMDIDQLAASLSRVTGVTWTEVVDQQTVDLFERLSGSLGKPDYQSSTDEDLSPGLLFQKFLDDAATMTCGTLLERESTPSPDHHLMVHAGLDDRPDDADDAIRANLSAALLAFHGRPVGPQDEALAPWHWLFTTVLDGGDDTRAAWRTVCVALILHPDFSAY